jgi:hypothetical protein
MEAFKQTQVIPSLGNATIVEPRDIGSANVNSTSGRENSKSKWTTLQHGQKTTSKLYDI